MSIEHLLEAISGANPCGEDTWLAEGRYVLQQPLEDSVGSGAEPNWDELKDAALQHLETSRDLRAAVVLALALFRTETLAGLRDGIALISGLLEKYNQEIHPLPPNDPVRSNTISNLSAPVGSDSPYAFVKFLRTTPLCKSTGGVFYSLLDIERAEKGVVSSDPSQPFPTTEQIDSALSNAPADASQATYDTLGEILKSTEKIEEQIKAAVGAANGPDLKDFKATVARMISVLAPHVSAPADSQLATSNGEGSSQTSRISKPIVHPVSALMGPVNSREDVDRCLKEVIEFFKKNEPSSPVPFMIERVRRVVKMDFLEVMRDMAPEAEGELKNLFGLKSPPAS
jgi:type VI secretion system protein ImpA